MAVFRHDPTNRYAVHPEDVLRIDRQLLMNSPVALYHAEHILREHIAILESYSYKCSTFDCASWEFEQVMHWAFAVQLKFPDYYGHNLDALNDCMRYLDIPEEGGVALVLWAFDAFWQRFPHQAWQVLDIIADAWGHLLYGRRLLGLVQTNDPNLSPKPVGAKPVMWNPREWLKKDRGQSSSSG